MSIKLVFKRFTTVKPACAWQ